MLSVDIHSHVILHNYNAHVHVHEMYNICRTKSHEVLWCYLGNEFSSKVCFDVRFTCYRRALVVPIIFLLQVISFDVHVFYYFVCIIHKCTSVFYNLKCNFWRAQYSSQRFVLFVTRCDISFSSSV